METDFHQSYAIMVNSQLVLKGKFEHWKASAVLLLPPSSLQVIFQFSLITE